MKNETRRSRQFDQKVNGVVELVLEAEELLGPGYADVILEMVRRKVLYKQTVRRSN